MYDEAKYKQRYSVHFYMGISVQNIYIVVHSKTKLKNVPLCFYRGINILNVLFRFFRTIHNVQDLEWSALLLSTTVVKFKNDLLSFDQR